MNSRDPRYHTACRCAGLLAVLMAFVLALPCTGDQLQWAPLSVCRAAAKVISRPSLLVSYCSQAEKDGVELWSITDLSVAATPCGGLYELNVTAIPRYRSDRAYSSAEFPITEWCWSFHEIETGAPYRVGVDLAYVYIHLGGGSFRCLATVLGLDCIVAVETLHLPEYVMNGLATRCAAEQVKSPSPLDGGSAPSSPSDP